MLWVPFDEKDHETPVKDFQNVPIAFKIYLDLSINVEGRSYTFKQELLLLLSSPPPLKEPAAQQIIRIRTRRPPPIIEPHMQ